VVIIVMCDPKLNFLISALSKFGKKYWSRNMSRKKRLIYHFPHMLTFYNECKFLFSHDWTAFSGKGLLYVEASPSHSNTPHSVGFLWTSDRPDAGTSTLQRTTLTREKHPCPLRDSNPQFQQASGRRTTP